MRMRGKKPIFNRKDCWDLRSTLAPVIAEGLKKFHSEMVRLREEDHPYRGAPTLVDCDISQLGAEEHDKKFEESYDEWLDTIAKMIYAFEDEENSPCPTDFEVEFDGAFKVNDEEKYNQFREAEKEHNAKVEEGLELFAKYYRSLWW